VKRRRHVTSRATARLQRLIGLSRSRNVCGRRRRAVKRNARRLDSSGRRCRAVDYPVATHLPALAAICGAPRRRTHGRNRGPALGRHLSIARYLAIQASLGLPVRIETVETETELGGWERSPH
jgi:hypothetical protein